MNEFASDLHRAAFQLLRLIDEGNSSNGSAGSAPPNTEIALLMEHGQPVLQELEHELQELETALVQRDYLSRIHSMDVADKTSLLNLLWQLLLCVPMPTAATSPSTSGLFEQCSAILQKVSICWIEMTSQTLDNNSTTTELRFSSLALQHRLGKELRNEAGIEGLEWCICALHHCLVNGLDDKDNDVGGHESISTVNVAVVLVQSLLPACLHSLNSDHQDEDRPNTDDLGWQCQVLVGCLLEIIGKAFVQQVVVHRDHGNNNHGNNLPSVFDWILWQLYPHRYNIPVAENQATARKEHEMVQMWVDQVGNYVAQLSLRTMKALEEANDHHRHAFATSTQHAKGGQAQQVQPMAIDNEEDNLDSQTSREQELLTAKVRWSLRCTFQVEHTVAPLALLDDGCISEQNTPVFWMMKVWKTLSLSFVKLSKQHRGNTQTDNGMDIQNEIETCLWSLSNAFFKLLSKGNRLDVFLEMEKPSMVMAILRLVPCASSLSLRQPGVLWSLLTHALATGSPNAISLKRALQMTGLDWVKRNNTLLHTPFPSSKRDVALQLADQIHCLATSAIATSIQAKDPFDQLFLKEWDRLMTPPRQHCI